MLFTRALSLARACPSGSFLPATRFRSASKEKSGKVGAEKKDAAAGATSRGSSVARKTSSTGKVARTPPRRAMLAGGLRLTGVSSLAELFRGKLVVVFGDSLSKNFAASLQCMLYVADSAAAKSYRLAQNKTAEWGVEFPSYKIRFVSVFSNWLNNATSLPDKNGVEQHRIDLDGLDQRIKDVLPIADIVIFQATAWWLPPINRWYVNGTEVTMNATAAYARGLTTLRDYVAESSRSSGSGGFKGRAVVMGVSPSHYNLPVRGVKKGKCNVTAMLTSAQTATVRGGDGALSDLRAIQQRVLGGSAVVYVDVKPMSDWRPDAHIQNWSVKDQSESGWGGVRLWVFSLVS
ncbi:unnamed protein product [Closterium sp. Naga37s-1]|nr:unnamed protein product [Closterium sp. Naga37s-1]